MDKEKVQWLVHEIVAGIAEKKGLDPVVLNLQDISSMCDYFIIASAPSIRQVKSIADAVKERLDSTPARLLHQEGLKEGRWILLDYGDIVVHLFISEDRDYYQLERIWKDASALDVDIVLTGNV